MIIGIDLQKKQRLMIEETNEALLRWSVEHKKRCNKLNRSIKRKEEQYQPYTTTLNVFLAVINALNEVAVQFEKSSETLNEILQHLPKSADGWVESDIALADSKLQKVKDVLDASEKRKEQVRTELKRIQQKLGNYRPNTKKYIKLQEQQESLRQELKELKGEITNERFRYRQAQELHRKNMETIRVEIEKEELIRLKTMSEPLENFIAALNIKSDALKEAMQKHNPEADLTSWKTKYFPSSSKQTTA
jgi:chromosome segregation ATPase